MEKYTGRNWPNTPPDERLINASGRVDLIRQGNILRARARTKGAGRQEKRDAQILAQWYNAQEHPRPKNRHTAPERRTEMTAERVIFSSNRMAFSPGIAQAIADSRALPAVGLSRNPDTGWENAEPWLRFEHDGRVHAQFAGEPFPKNLPAETVNRLATLLEDHIEEFQDQHVNEDFPVRAAHEAKLMRRRAELGVHTVDRRAVDAVLKAARAQGYPHGAAAVITRHIFNADAEIAAQVMEGSAEAWRTPVSLIQAKMLMKRAGEIGLDEYALMWLAQAMGREVGENASSGVKPDWSRRDRFQDEVRRSELSFDAVVRLGDFA